MLGEELGTVSIYLLVVLHRVQFWSDVELGAVESGDCVTGVLGQAHR